MTRVLTSFSREERTREREAQASAVASEAVLVSSPQTSVDKVSVTIEYCRLSHYRQTAERLATALSAEFPVERLEFELLPSHGGVFEVSVDGRLIFSKRATFRIPEADEIAYHVRAALAPRSVGASRGPKAAEAEELPLAACGRN
jgi:selenoprotein W-related protein